MASKKQSSGKTAAEVGAVLAAAAAAGAGYYFYGSDKAKQHRAAANKWAKDMKSEVVKETKKLKKIDQKEVAKVVDRAAAAYATVRTVNPNELKAAASELKKNWRRVSEEVVRRVKGTPKKQAKKAAKKSSLKRAAPKAVKKAPKKAPKKAGSSSKKRSR